MRNAAKSRWLVTGNFLVQTQTHIHLYVSSRNKQYTTTLACMSFVIRFSFITHFSHLRYMYEVLGHLGFSYMEKRFNGIDLVVGKINGLLVCVIPSHCQKILDFLRYDAIQKDTLCSLVLPINLKFVIATFVFLFFCFCISNHLCCISLSFTHSNRARSPSLFT